MFCKGLKICILEYGIGMYVQCTLYRYAFAISIFPDNTASNLYNAVYTLTVLSQTAHNLYFVSDSTQSLFCPDSTQSLFCPRQHTISILSQTVHNLYSVPDSAQSLFVPRQYIISTRSQAANNLYFVSDSTESLFCL